MIKGLVESLLEGKLEAIVPLLDLLKEQADPRWCAINQAFGRLHWSLRFSIFSTFLKEAFWMELNGASQEVFDRTWEMVKRTQEGALQGFCPTDEEVRQIREAFESAEGMAHLRALPTAMPNYAPGVRGWEQELRRRARERGWEQELRRRAREQETREDFEAGDATNS